MSQQDIKQKSKYQVYLERDFERLLGEFEALELSVGSICTLEGLALALSDIGQDEYLALVREERIYQWLKSKVRDGKLSRQLRFIALKDNAVSLVRERISELKDLVRHPQNSFAYNTLGFYTSRLELFCDRERCVQCGICVAICPKEALSFGKYIEIDQDKCSLCSMCSGFCPTGALSFVHEGDEHNFLLEFKRLPQLPDFGEQSGSRVRDYIVGTITLKSDCPEKCEKCVSVCPTGAIKRFDQTGVLPRVMIDDDICIHCGACARVCPDQIIDLRRTELKTVNDNFSHTWDQVLEELLGSEHINLYHARHNRSKLADLALQSGEVKYQEYLEPTEPKLVQQVSKVQKVQKVRKVSKVKSKKLESQKSKSKKLAWKAVRN